MYGQLKGDYIINLYDIHSEKVMSNKITHNGNDKVISVDLDKNLPNGTSSQMLSCLHVGVERRYSARGVGVEGSITIIIISD